MMRETSSDPDAFTQGQSKSPDFVIRRMQPTDEREENHSPLEGEAMSQGRKPASESVGVLLF